MPRLAGDRMKGLAGRGGMSAADAVTTLAVLGGLGGISVTGLMGLLDLFNGEARIDNSGEYLANSAITGIPIATTALGVGAAAAADPVARGLLGVIGDVAIAREAGRDYGADALMASLQRDSGAGPQRQAVDAAAGRVDASTRRLAEEMHKRIQADPKLTAEALLARSGRNLARGAGFGALAGSVPAVMMMGDGSDRSSDRERG